jgi:hypothetical protein
MTTEEVDGLFKGEGFEGLVLAGGGVPRDCLSLFLEAPSRAVRVARAPQPARVSANETDSAVDESGLTDVYSMYIRAGGYADEDPKMGQ